LSLLAALLAGLLLTATALLTAALPWLLPRLPGFLSATALLTTLTALLTTLVLLAWFIVRVHNCSMSCLPIDNDLMRPRFRFS
jgi:hypothetical protein